MPQDKIIIKGAKEHNLKNIDLEIPRDKITVVTGVSGSGKSSLAFDTVFAEGQRRYIESLSAYARQFLDRMKKPEVESIEGLSPTIAIQQKSAGHNPRSTVGTITEINDYLRVLFARIGKIFCYQCGKRIERQSLDQIMDQILRLGPEVDIILLAPIIRSRKGEYRSKLKDLLKQGFIQGRIDDEIKELTEDISLERYKKHTIEVVVDRMRISEAQKQKSRLSESLELGLKIGKGIVIVYLTEGEELIFSEQFACVDCGINYEELSPRMFSFNNPYGACSRCDGLGKTLEIDPTLLVQNRNLSIKDGAISILPKDSNSRLSRITKEVAKHYDFKLDVPFNIMTEKQQNIILFGTGEELIDFKFKGENPRHKYNYEFQRSFEGIIPWLERRFVETKSSYIRREIGRYMSKRNCPLCKGDRFKPSSLSVKVGEKNIAEITGMSIVEASRFFMALKFTPEQELIARQILREIQERLAFMINVGLDYLTLERSAETLSSGEAQRIQLATQIGSKLCGVLYILDEPSIGLHQRDIGRLLGILEELKDLGNTLLVVEHDEQTIRKADHIIDMGPGAGEHGGNIVVEGPLEKILRNEDSLTGAYLSGRLQIETKTDRRISNGGSLIIKGARQHNLKNIDVSIPLGLFVCITGVSGSGKSTLVNDILYNSLARKLHRSKAIPGDHDFISGIENIDKVIIIDQSPIGRTPRSNPATYTGVFTPIREVYSQLPEARRRGYKPGRFSFNVKGGRCESCQGAGSKLIEMHFLPDIYIRCDVCKGLRYNSETLEVRFKGKNIKEVLEMTVEEAIKIFGNMHQIRRKLQTMLDVGLGYMRLGQPAPTLAGGEAQRIKLSKELGKKSTGKTLYILDEPTTGLHFADVQRLLNVLNRLVDNGNTVIVIEHNLNIIISADHIIDLGPEGGDKGGSIIASGTPEEIAQISESHTGKYLKRVLSE